jgi:LysR family transcriptional activator of nhaA
MPTRSSTWAASSRQTLRESATRDGQASLDFRVGVADSVAKTVVYRLLEPALQLADAGAHGVQRRHASPNCWASWRCTGRPGDRRRTADAPGQREGLQPPAGPLDDELLRRAGGCVRTLKGRLSPLPGRRADADPRSGLVVGAAAVRRLADAAPAAPARGRRVRRPGLDGHLRPRRPRRVRLAVGAGSRDRAQHGVQAIGRSDELVESFYAISVERRISHPCVVAITLSSLPMAAVAGGRHPGADGHRRPAAGLAGAGRRHLARTAGATAVARQPAPKPHATRCASGCSGCASKWAWTWWPAAARSRWPAAWCTTCTGPRPCWATCKCPECPELDHWLAGRRRQQQAQGPAPDRSPHRGPGSRRRHRSRAAAGAAVAAGRTAERRRPPACHAAALPAWRPRSGDAGL